MPLSCKPLVAYHFQPVNTFVETENSKICTSGVQKGGERGDGLEHPRQGASKE